MQPSLGFYGAPLSSVSTAGPQHVVGEKLQGKGRWPDEMSLESRIPCPYERYGPEAEKELRYFQEGVF